MVQYTLAQDPAVILAVSGKDSPKAREKALDQLIALIDEGSLSNALADGFGTEQLVEIRPLTPSATVQQQEDSVVEAIQVLNQLATLKVKVQASRDDALQVRQLVDLLFTDDPMTDVQVTDLKEGFKVLKSFAHSNLRFKEARAQAEQARQILDQALGN
jgi:soluble cytochrome b562